MQIVSSILIRIERIDGPDAGWRVYVAKPGGDELIWLCRDHLPQSSFEVGASLVLAVGGVVVRWMDDLGRSK
jgi:hypothetical protein